ncbi:hypothetical protein [Arthrobacter sp. Soil763]|nr:hypothetical protein [Arthrobacter sp. Soil763]
MGALVEGDALIITTPDRLGRHRLSANGGKPD